MFNRLKKASINKNALTFVTNYSDLVFETYSSTVNKVICLFQIVFVNTIKEKSAVTPLSPVKYSFRKRKET